MYTRLKMYPKVKYLISIPNGSIQTVDIGNEEDTEEEQNALDQTELRRDHLDPPHTGTTSASESFDREVSPDSRLDGIRGIFLGEVVDRHVHFQVVTGTKWKQNWSNGVKACLKNPGAAKRVA
jgi:hypothetical protein